MIVTIYRNHLMIAQVEPLDTSELSQQKQIEDLVNLYFESDSYIDLQIGDYIVIPKTEQKYVLNKLPEVTDKGLFRYDCVFEGSFHELKKTLILLDNDYNFPLTGNAKTFLQFIVENLNRNGGDYTVGKYIESEDMTVQFANWNALEAITELSGLLGFDWYLDGTVLNFDSKGFETPYVLQVGMKVGFLSLQRTTVNTTPIQTVVYGYGSTQNLPPRTGDGLTYNSPLLTENRLYFEGVNSESKLEKNTDKYGKRETVQIFEEIKPERTGTITSLDASDYRSFFDSNIDFNINEQKMEGIKPKIKFISGPLIGLQFDISYDNSGKKITMDLFTDDSGTYPNETIKPGIGDEYKLFDIIMPQSYIDDATERLEAATQAYLDEHSKSMVIYEGEIDKEYIQANGIVLDIGDTVRIVSGVFRIDQYYEIKGLTQSITKPDEYKIQFGDVLPKSLLNMLLEASFNTKQSIYTVSSTQITNNDITNIIGEDISWQTL
jgi:hypothetical protein